MRCLTLLIPILFGSLVLGCVDLTPMWEKTRDGNVAPGTGGVATTGGIVAAGGAPSETGGSVIPATGGVPVGDGGPGMGGMPGVDAPQEVGVDDAKPASDIATTGGIGGGTGGALRTGGVGGAGGSSTDGGLSEVAVDSAKDTPVDLVRDTSPDQPQVDVAVLSGPLVHYHCESATGDKLDDDSGKNHPGTLIGPYSFVTGKVGKALSLTSPAGVDGGVPSSYVALPANLFSAVNDMTVATWINLNSNKDWTRIFDFGASQTSYMFLTPSNGLNHTLRFAISTAGIYNEQVLDGPALSSGTWVHLAVVLDAAGAKLFVDGTSVAVNSGVSLRASALGDMANNWIGRSQFTDPYFDGLIDDFRVYDRALGLTEIAALAGQ